MNCLYIDKININFTEMQIYYILLINGIAICSEVFLKF